MCKKAKKRSSPLKKSVAVQKRKTSAVVPARVQQGRVVKTKNTVPLKPAKKPAGRGRNKKCVKPVQQPSSVTPTSVRSELVKRGNLKFTDFTPHREIGRGSFGVAYLVSPSKQPLTNLVLKVLNHNKLQGSGWNPKDALNEYNTQKKLSHENICQVMGFLKKTDVSALLMEYCEIGDLFTYISGKSICFPKLRVRDRFYMRQIVSGVEYLHTQAKLVHMDIKPENILLTSRDTIKLTDFGVAFKIKSQRQEFNKDLGGTFMYKPPELFQKEICFDSTTDVWAIGCIAYELADRRGAHPFLTNPSFKTSASVEAKVQAALWAMANMKRGTYDCGDFQTLDTDIKEFLRQTIGTDRLKRPLISELLETAWLKENKKIPGNLSLIPKKRRN